MATLHRHLRFAKTKHESMHPRSVVHGGLDGGKKSGSGHHRIVCDAAAHPPKHHPVGI